MREAITDSYIFAIIITIIGVCAVIIISSLSYSKTFKIKNRIVEIIEKYQGYTDEAESEINTLLKDSGYKMRKNNSKCPTGRGPKLEDEDEANTGYEAINTLETYKYCVYKFDTIKGSYYSVVTYMSMEIPLIGDLINLEFPVYGESKVFVDF